MTNGDFKGSTCMTPRERVQAAVEYRTPDRIPLRIFAAPGGLYEHGQKLADLTKACGHDFYDLSGLTLPAGPPPEDFDADGRYHAFKTDEWGTRWEYRLFGIWGHPVACPLSDLSKLDAYQAPAPPPTSGPALAAAKDAVAAHKRTYYYLGYAGMLFERLHMVRGYEDTIVDVMMDTPEIHRIADIILAHQAACVQHAIAIDADAVAFGDDFGTQNGPLFSPEVWRRFFAPRYRTLFDPLRQAGKKIFFHSCGRLGYVLDDLRELGVDVIWPQLPAYDLPELARWCRTSGMAIELHPDRGDLMQRGTPQQVRDHVLHLVDLFDSASGGSILYLEVDPGFPWPNVEALFHTAMELHG